MPQYLGRIKKASVTICLRCASGRLQDETGWPTRKYAQLLGVNNTTNSELYTVIFSGDANLSMMIDNWLIFK